MTADMTGRALKHKHISDAAFTVGVFTAVTHQFSSLWDWKALRKDVRGQGSYSRLMIIHPNTQISSKVRILNDERLELVRLHKVVIGHGVRTPGTHR